MSQNRCIIWIALLTFVLAWPLVGFTQPSSDAFNALRQELESLKKGQEGIRNDLQEIKKLLQSRPGRGQRPAAIRDVDLVLDVSEDPKIGDENATLTLVEFSDFQCPYCGRHIKSVFPKLQSDYIATGKIRYVMRDFPLEFHQQAHKAAVAAWCAHEQGKYWDMHHYMFSNQNKLQPEDLVKQAQTLGMDMPAFEACFASDKYDEKIEASMADGRKAGVRGTPSFLLGYTASGGDQVKAVRFIRGAQPFNAFKENIDQLLAAKN
jgi:protein-disulfide isomerase